MMSERQLTDFSIAVLVKQVPQAEELDLDSNGRLRRASVPLEMNAYCRRAVSQGVTLAQLHGGRCTVFCLGPPSAEDTVREALAWGADTGGGMGAAGKNFYNDVACRLGFEEAPARIQRLYLAGHKSEAVAAVPDRLVDEIALVGTGRTNSRPASALGCVAGKNPRARDSGSARTRHHGGARVLALRCPDH
jgi:hypothetical protein